MYLDVHGKFPLVVLHFQQKWNELRDFSKYKKGNILWRCIQNFSCCYMKTDGQKIIERTKTHILVSLFRQLTRTEAQW